jgi:branched-chain amino acid aminotransferase
MLVRSFRSGLERFCKNHNKRWISSSQLTIEKTQDKSSFENRPKKEDLVFGSTMSDHMLMIEWETVNGWGVPRIVPYQNLSLSPGASSLHYGLQCFEGMKAYKSLSNDSLRLFRPDKNMVRFSNSMDRLHMPGTDFDREELTKCIAELVRVDQDWIPSGEGYSLYIRPTCIATDPGLGVVSLNSRVDTP